MYPELFKIGPFVIHSYGFMLAAGFLISGLVLRGEFKRIGEVPDFAFEIITAAAIGGILGAKINYLLEHTDYLLDDPVGMIFSGAGLVWYGGFLGGTAAVLGLIRYRKKPVWRSLDSIALLLPLGYSFGRGGCFLVGDDYGIPSNLPWALAFPEGSPPTLDRVHPTQIYEIILSLLIFALLWSLRKKANPPGFLFFLYIFLAGVERFFIEFIRTNEKILLGFTEAQWVSIGMILIGITAAIYIKKARGSGEIKV
ncbi:MAG: prolipoprotein diacylglyceryl transferase [Fidelibacterota bacterium]